MAKQQNTIIIIALIVVGIFLFRGFIPELQAVISIDSTEVHHPRGMGYLNPIEIVAGNLFILSGFKCQDLFDSDDFACPIGGPPGIPETSAINYYGLMDDKLHISIDEPFFFQGDFVSLTVVTDPDEDFVEHNIPNLLVNSLTFAWWETDLPPGSSQDTAIELFGKPVDWVDLSRPVNLVNTPQEFTFDIGQLPIGEYRFYVVFAENVNVDVLPLCTFHLGGFNCVGSIVFERWSQMLEVNFLVNPAPLTTAVFEGQMCPDGYEPQQDSQFPNGVCEADEGSSTCVCIRDDLEGLACVELGCPITVDPDTGEIISYTCGSNGFCSETIFYAEMCLEDSECNEGDICEPTSGICFNEDLFESFIGCEVTSDCTFDPNCVDSNGEDVTVECVENLCEYSGQCDVDLTGDCNLLGCPVDFICLEDSGSCLRIAEDEEVGDIVTEEETPIIIGEIEAIGTNTLIIIAIILAVIGFFFFRRKRNV